MQSFCSILIFSLLVTTCLENLIISIADLVKPEYSSGYILPGHRKIHQWLVGYFHSTTPKNGQPNIKLPHSKNKSPINICTRLLLTWTPQVGLHAFSSSTKTSTQRALGAMSKNSLRGINANIWGINSLSSLYMYCSWILTSAYELKYLTSVL